jgi:hypothetical protein
MEVSCSKSFFCAVVIALANSAIAHAVFSACSSAVRFASVAAFAMPNPAALAVDQFPLLCLANSVTMKG